MSEKAIALSRQALKLTPAERIELVDEILSSLDQPDEKLDKLWASEVEDRLIAYRCGEVKAIRLEDMLAKCRSQSM